MSAGENQVKCFLLYCYSPVTCRRQLFSALADSLNGLSLRLADLLTPRVSASSVSGPPVSHWGLGVWHV